MQTLLATIPSTAQTLMQDAENTMALVRAVVVSIAVFSIILQIIIRHVPSDPSWREYDKKNGTTNGNG